MRANTLAQHRIRELETRVVALEQERADHVLREGAQAAHVRRLEYALECVRVGWETMAQGLEEAGVETAASVARVPPMRAGSARVSLGESVAAQSSRQHISRAARPMEQIGEGEEDAALPGPSAALCGGAWPASVTRRRSRRDSFQVQTAAREAAWQEPEAVHAAADTHGDVPDEERGEERGAEHGAPQGAEHSAEHVPLQDTHHTPPQDAPYVLEQATAAVPASSPPVSPTPAPGPKRKRARSSRISLADLSDTASDLDRGPRRARKSVNYALPKLNTKMRKPDSAEPDTDTRTAGIAPLFSTSEPSPPRTDTPARRATPHTKRQLTPSARLGSLTQFVPVRTQPLTPDPSVWAHPVQDLASPEPKRRVRPDKENQPGSARDMQQRRRSTLDSVH